MSKVGFLVPDWPAPKNVVGLVTNRSSGDFNLATHVGDLEEAVLLNRQVLQDEIGVKKPIQWVNQIHGTTVFCTDLDEQNQAPDADAIFTRESNLACGILTADCLPVFFCDPKGEEIAVAHAGWRGLVAGILENTVKCFTEKPEALIAWLGPAIGPCHFEVGSEVREAFINAAGPSEKDAVAAAFSASNKPGKWMGDLYQLARARLSALGVNQVYGGGLCTSCQTEQYYSYRRNKNTGRFASIIWRK